MTAPSDQTILVDPLSFDPSRHGPPYLPVQPEVSPKQAKTASLEVRANQADVFKQTLRQFFGQSLPLFQKGSKAAELAVLLAVLRAEAQLHQAHHWATSGPQFYADHQLFDRAYNTTFEMVDGLAERAVGLGVPSLVEPLHQVNMMQRYTQIIYREAPNSTSGLAEGMVHCSFLAVLGFMEVFDLAYTALKAQDVLTPGTDNLLQGYADGHETLIYLFKQRTQLDTTMKFASGTPLPNDSAWKTW